MMADSPDTIGTPLLRVVRSDGGIRVQVMFAMADTMHDLGPRLVEKLIVDAVRKALEAAARQIRLGHVLTCWLCGKAHERGEGHP